MEVAAEPANCDIDRLVVAHQAGNASNIIICTQTRNFVDDRVQIVCIDPDGRNTFYKIVILSRGRGQRNWMKAQTLGSFDEQLTHAPAAA